MFRILLILCILLVSLEKNSSSFSSPFSSENNLNKERDHQKRESNHPRDIVESHEDFPSLENILEISRFSKKNFYIKGNTIGTGRYSNVFFAWKVDLSQETKNQIGEETLVIDPSLLNLTDHQISILRGSPVALKELKNVQEWKILREVSILKLLNGYPHDHYRYYNDDNDDHNHKLSLSLENPQESEQTQGKEFIVRLLDIVKYHYPPKRLSHKRPNSPKKHIGLIMEYVNNEQFYSLLPRLPYNDLQKYMRQLLQGLSYANSLGVFHRDIKPQNIVIDVNKELLKIIDWGLAEYYSQDHPDFSPRVASKYYKAPELLLGIRNYDFSVDSWSVGCLFSQMLFRLGTLKTNYFTRVFSKYPKTFVGIFLKNSPSPDALFPGWDNNDQLVKIASLLGGDNIISISKKYNGTIPNDYLTLTHLKKTRKIFNSTTPTFTDPRTFEFLITQENQDLVTFQALDLLSKLLTLDFKYRIHPKDALKHPFFTLHPSQHSWIVPQAPGISSRSSILSRETNSSRGNKDFCPFMSLFSFVYPYTLST
ncbi:casein kinase II [Cryptosporidium sp. chipmunk genotype I]|uniref:casein kinase II n=1 Tax=Cryptosporidium sp. chipmunk genotype I TaxID=1280935 RepID=UPI00351AAA6A|nr:casein kinase II [Cryptosporidium sp. chipmunk genotype I]